MEILDRILSADKTATKYVVEYEDGLIGEMTYVDYPNKDIVCVPTQVACKMGCKFCHLTNDPNLANRNLKAYEMEQLLSIALPPQHRRPAVMSFMGSGEPLLNWEEMVDAMYMEKNFRGPDAIRFAFATMVPQGGAQKLAFRLADAIALRGLNAKAHLSLHFTEDEMRWRYMPYASEISASLFALENYMRITGNQGEVHYTLMDGINDRRIDLANLARLVRPDIGIKILHYSPNAKLGATISPRVEYFVEELKRMGYKAEYYKPNGLDIGSSCGQFDLTRYRRG